MRVQAHVSMSTNQPPDLAAIRALSGKLESGPQHGLDYALAAFEAAKVLPALLDELDRLRDGIQSIVDNDRSGSWITVDLEDLLG